MASFINTNIASLNAQRNLTTSQSGLATSLQGEKSIYYLAGLAEGTETIAVFCAFCLWPAAFAVIALTFAAVCSVSAISRLVMGWRAFG